jgi:uncharacterized phage-associated protein
MASVFDAAKYILEKQGRISTWKLQKLCYYAQAWSLAWDGAELFPEDFEAWKNGPVCRALFYKHRGTFMVESGDIPDGDSAVFSDTQRETLDIILRDYGKEEPYSLRELSHSEAPWKNARGDLPWDADCDVVITKDAMGEYYGSL